MDQGWRAADRYYEFTPPFVIEIALPAPADLSDQAPTVGMTARRPRKDQSVPTRHPDALLARLRPAQQDGVRRIDLADLRWMPPSAMVATAAQAHRAHLDGTGFELRGPTDSEPAHYAARMRLGRVLSDLGATHDLPTARAHDREEDLIEVVRIDSADTVDRLARLVYRKVLPRGGKDLATALHRSVGEVGENVMDHSGTIGYLAAQTLPRRRELLIAIADAGVGMLATLAHRGVLSHEAAIALATQEQVSRYDEPDRGRGLPSALHLIGGQSGSLYIASGTAAIRHFPTTRRYLRADDAFDGTIVEARIPLADG
jgi:hypothetical protein